MKKYLVFMTDLALAPLQGQNPRGGRLENFDDLVQAQKFAEEQKGNWDRVFLFDRTKDGRLERVEHYQNGRRYVDNRTISEE